LAVIVKKQLSAIGAFADAPDPELIAADFERGSRET
jgi:hypothetical protein